ncbi:MAG: tRNA pseudouridine(13) synthase TruD [Gammaproteobacteria bacterium]|nr:tRNA pseudouridine(13) synthase TruD [Gammaproteobacteria bacterium]
MAKPYFSHLFDVNYSAGDMSPALDYLETLNHFGRAHYQKRPRGTIRSVPEDFRVHEVLGFELSGDGPHVWLHVRKRLLNTVDVIRILAKWCGLEVRDVGYSGLKDRNAVTTQWVSLPMELTSRLPLMNDFELGKDGFEIIEMEYHQKKLKRGVHHANYFQIVIRFDEEDHEQTESLLQSIKSDGVPNYFGEQRFGRNGNNLRSAERYFTGELKKPTRQLRGFMLSAARSWLFNLVLSQRVADGSWNTALPGDAIQFDGSGSFFLYDETDISVRKRVNGKVCHPTGPLWGAGEMSVGEPIERFEKECLEEMEVFCTGLENNGLKHQRRALRVVLPDLSWRWLSVDAHSRLRDIDADADSGNILWNKHSQNYHGRNEHSDANEGNLAIKLSFSLPGGCFATSVLREFIEGDTLPRIKQPLHRSEGAGLG